LKKWLEDEYDLEGTVNIQKFTMDVCKEKQRGMTGTSKVVQQQTKKRTNTSYQCSMTKEITGK
jgi:hypothetical protein